MRILACPIAIIEAPIEVVHNLLELSNFGRWIDGTVIDVKPEGKMIVGQQAIITAKAFMVTWKVHIRVVGIDAKHNTISYDVFSPFGIKNEEILEYKKLSDTSCEVRYNCNLIFADGIKGLLIKTLLGKKMIDVPNESIRRLKEQAEKDYKKHRLS